MNEKRYWKRGENPAKLDITGQAHEKGAPVIKLGTDYRAYLRNHLSIETRNALIAKLLSEIQAENKSTLSKAKGKDGNESE